MQKPVTVAAADMPLTDSGQKYLLNNPYPIIIEDKTIVMMRKAIAAQVTFHLSILQDS